LLIPSVYNSEKCNKSPLILTAMSREFTTISFSISDNYVKVLLKTSISL
jgi:hypothetical protein